MKKLTTLFIFLIIGFSIIILQCESKRKKSKNSWFVRLPSVMRGFTWEKLIELKKTIGDNKWVRLKHLFLLNPHIPVLVLTGHDVSKDDIINVPSWMQIEDDESNDDEDENSDGFG